MKPLLALAAVLLCLQAQEAKVTPHGPQLPGPLRPASGPSWRVERDEWKGVQAADYDAWFEMDRWRRNICHRLIQRRGVRPAGIEVDAVQFLPTADDGARAVFL